jgi:cation:H+ antiporter
VILIVAGLALLVSGGELLVRGAVRLAAVLGVAPLVVGLTVVAFGTSAPELVVSLQAVSASAADLSLGNVLGSNIFNVLVILGLAALVAPLVVSRRVVQVEVPVMIAISAGTWGLAANGRLGVTEGVLLLLTIAGYTGWLLRSSRAEATDDAAADAARDGWLGMALMVLAGLALLLIGARVLVDGATDLARALDVSEAVIGLTIVAAGTSLPEVAASVVATYRGQRDIAVGNVLGSNVFNLTMILGAAAVWGSGLTVSPDMLRVDFAVMLVVAVACLPIFWTGHRITRWEGLLFLAGYAAYVTWLVRAA